MWERRFVNVHRLVAWSSDHRAIAVMVQDDPKWIEHNGNNFSKLLVWQEGHPPSLLPLHNLYQDWDGVLNLWWSPDKKHLLFRAYYSGGADSNAGQLLCYDLRAQRFSPGPTFVRWARWVNSHRIRYARVKVVPMRPGSSEKTFIADRHTQLWRCP